MNIEKNLGASTITMITSIKGNVDIVAAFDLLCIIWPRNEDGTRFIHPSKTRNKIPYFNVSNSIVCVKYKGCVRGIRQNEGQMNNVVSIDLQCSNKNINLKLAKTKIQLTGASSEEMGNEAFKVLCAHLNMIQDNVEYKNKIDEVIRNNTLEWMFSNQETLSSLMDKEEFPENVDTRLAKFLFGYYSEFDEFELFKKKVEKIMKFEFLCSENVQPDNPRISNSVYNYSLGKEISLLNMTMHLRKKGFNANFHNWNTTYVNVSIPIMNEEKSITPESYVSGFTATTEEDFVEPEEDKKAEKIKVHRFIIYRGGSIRQTSPTNYEEAFEVRNVILDSLEDFEY